MIPVEIERAYSEALSAAHGLERPKLGDDPVIAYGRRAKPAAYTLFLAYSHAGLRATLAPATLASVHIMPYRETGPLIIYALDPKDLRALNAAMAATHLGLHVYDVAPPMHEAVEEQLDHLGVERIRLPKQAPPLLTMVLASLLWAPPMMGARRERVRAEVEALESALEWVARSLHGQLEAARSLAGARPAYTPTTLPGAYYHAVASGRDPLPLEEAEPRRGEEIVAYVAGVERHDYRDTLLYARVRGAKIVEVPVNTDPVTATVYSTLAALLITGKII